MHLNGLVYQRPPTIRQLKGTELRYGTAIKIEEAIDQLATLQKKEQRTTRQMYACGQLTQYFVSLSI